MATAAVTWRALLLPDRLPFRCATTLVVLASQIANLRRGHPYMTESSDALREVWLGWAGRTLGGETPQISAAADAAVRLLTEQGATSEQAVDAARAAWAAPGNVPLPNLTVESVAPAGQSRASFAGAPSRDELVTGNVAGFQPRSELAGGRYMTVWDFRVERPGLPAVAVEMRGFHFDGSINNGDEVRIAGATRSGQIAHLRSIENLTSNATVRASGRDHPAARATKRTVTFLVRLVFLVLVIVILVSGILFASSNGLLK